MTPEFALSTWSLHRAIGISYPDAPGNNGSGAARETWGPGTISLTEVPARMAEMGIDRLEICSFHLNRAHRAHLDAVRASIQDAGVSLQALLIDDGDITDPEHSARDTAWVGDWIDVAARLGAETARVIAGKQPPTEEVLNRSIGNLAELGRRGEGQGVRVTTENWFDTTPGPREVHTILDGLDGTVGLLADMGNWTGPGKYADLASLFERADYCHAKCSFAAGFAMDRDDYGQCLTAAANAGYTGPFTLIYDGPDADEWQAIAMERDFIAANWA